MKGKALRKHSLHEKTAAMSQKVFQMTSFFDVFSVQRLTHIKNVTCEATTEKGVTTNWKAMSPLVFGEAQTYLPGLYITYL